MEDSQVLKRRGYVQGISIGEGSYAKVRSAYSERLKINVAVKIINKQRAPKDFLEYFLPRELDILASLKHKNIVRTYEIFESSNGKVYMVMELGVQGNLLEFIELRGALTPQFSKKLFRQMCDAISFIHDLDIAHRDVKCENLLLDTAFNLKVADFGFSRRLKYNDCVEELSKTFCGSEGYAAPEVLQGIPYAPKQYDVWSMGVVLFVMVFGSMPFDDSNIKKMIKAQKERRLTFPKLAVVPSTLKDLIHRLLHPDPLKRIQVSLCLTHPWLQAVCDSTEGSEKVQTGQSSADDKSPKDCRCADSAVAKAEDVSPEIPNLGTSVPTPLNRCSC